MKNILLASVMALGLSASADLKLSPEESAVLMNSRFHETLELIRTQRQQQGETLRVVSIDKLDMGGGAVYLNVRLDTKISAAVNGPFKTIGNIVCGIKYGPMADPYVDSVYFSPVTAPPSSK